MSGGVLPVVSVAAMGRPAVASVTVQGQQGPKGDKGDKGDPGTPAGGAGSAQVFAQVTPAANWIIAHSFGRRPLVAVYDASGAEMLADIVASITSVTVTFAQPTAGSAVLA